MIEKTERRIIIPESEINNIDLELLSYAEHHFIGSGVTMNGASEFPLMPVALINQDKDMSNAAMFHMREAKPWIRSNVADLILLGAQNVGRYTVLFKLSDFDVMTGEISDLPDFYGVYDYEEKVIIEGEDKLISLGVNEERARNFAEARIGHFFPNGTFNTQPESD